MIFRPLKKGRKQACATRPKFKCGSCSKPGQLVLFIFDKSMKMHRFTFREAVRSVTTMTTSVLLSTDSSETSECVVTQITTRLQKVLYHSVTRPPGAVLLSYPMNSGSYIFFHSTCNKIIENKLDPLMVLLDTALAHP